MEKKIIYVRHIILMYNFFRKKYENSFFVTSLLAIFLYKRSIINQGTIFKLLLNRYVGHLIYVIDEITDTYWIIDDIVISEQSSVHLYYCSVKLVCTINHLICHTYVEMFQFWLIVHLLYHRYYLRIHVMWVFDLTDCELR